MMIKRELTAVLIAANMLLVGSVADAAAQQKSVRFQNAMQTIADVRITPVGGTTATEFTIGAGNVVTFNFTSKLFDIQVIPRDARDTGFRFLSVDLDNLSVNAQGRIVRLDGKFAPATKKLVCYRRRICRHKCRCCLQQTRGERIEVDLTATLRNGASFSIESPKMDYSEVMGA